jgi:phosphate transport system protein
MSDTDRQLESSGPNRADGAARPDNASDTPAGNESRRREAAPVRDRTTKERAAEDRIGQEVDMPMRPGPMTGLNFQRQLVQLKRRVLAEARVATEMLETALEAMWHMDLDACKDVRERDREVDREEVAIETECYRLLTMQRPFGHDFRFLNFCLRANADIERIADHASSLAKITRLIHRELPAGAGTPPWPVAMREMGERIPLVCQNLFRAVVDEDVDAARAIVIEDKRIDRLDKQLYDEIRSWMEAEPAMIGAALYCYRVGRELERVGDLIANMAEDVVYLATGEIIRHEKHRLKAADLGVSSPPEKRA